jgi:hypothetical protein
MLKRSPSILALVALGLLLLLALAGSTLQSSARTETTATDQFLVERAGQSGQLDATDAKTITVSGTVNGPGGPVSGVWIGIGSPQDWQETFTNGSGFYSVSILTAGELWIHVRPEVSTRLTQANLWMGGVTADVTQNLTVTHGHLLRVQPMGGGQPIVGELGPVEVQPLQAFLPDNSWYSLDGGDSTHWLGAVLPPDIYYVTAHEPPAGFYLTSQAFDLRHGDLSADLPLNTSYVHPIPYDPPDASKIGFSSPDDLGEAVVTGAPGAALPLARVLLVNLNSGHQAHTISEADGSFAARIYAPPGSAVMVKHGPASHRWYDLERGLSEGVNPFPGTILNLPHTHAGAQYELAFAAAGGIDVHADDPGDTRNYVGSAWAVTGTVGPIVVDGEWTRVLDGLYEGQMVPGLYLGGLNWTHPALGDLDDDGDLDLLVGERAGQLVLFRNHGSPTSPDWQFETIGYAGVDTGSWAYPALADVTGDGAPDLFVGSGNGTVAAYYNDGTLAESVWPGLPDDTLSAGENAAPTLADLDADGDLDLLVGHGGGTLYLFRNTGTSSSPAWTYETDSYGGISEASEGLQAAFLDLDDDTDRDLLVGLCGWVVWYERGGSSTEPTWTRHDEDPIGYGGGSCASSPAVGDWSGDSLPDLAIGEHWGVLRFFSDDDVSGWSEQPFSFPFDLAGDSAPAVADWDDDGDLDLLVGQAHGELHRYRNDGSSASPDWTPEDPLPSLPWTDHPHAFPAFADIDGDDDYDLFVGEGGWQGPGAGGNIHYYRNDGTRLEPDWVYVTGSFLGLDVGGWSTPVFVDINADDDLDLFVGDEAGTLTYVENTGTPASPSWATPVHPYAALHLGAYSAPAFFDVDEDEDLDMLVGLGSGSLAYVRNVGTTNEPAWELVSTVYPGLEAGEHAVPTAADLNGDEKPDLLLGGGDGGLSLYLNEGPGGSPGAGEVYAPGDLFKMDATLRLHGPAISASTDLNEIAVDGWMSLMVLFDETGLPLPARDYFMSTMLTPTGFPIQRSEQARLGLDVHLVVENLRYLGGHAIEGDLAATVQLPEDLPAAIYRPILSLDFAGVPSSTEWLAANVVRETFGSNEAPLPPMTVGEVNAPRLVWRLLMDDAVQGTRGAGAREDEGTFGLASQIVYQGAPYYTPPVDERTGQSLTYRLEPFLPTISFTDRRMPTPPLLPFELPGGQLRVEIREPDGTVRTLGPDPLAQSFNRTKTTRMGDDLNPGTVQLEDVYSLQAASDRFQASFGQYGHHVITMTGTVDDLWGNRYEGGGTYDVWIAHPLDIEAGVLPGTPLAPGDAFNPVLRLLPRVPAKVNLTLTLFPDSDPAQAIVHTISGRANRFGAFSQASQPADLPIVVDDPGEYRVDVTAIYTDANGVVHMGALTWGGVVMTPLGEAHLVAHGRRGLDSLAYIPNLWFVSSRDLVIPEGAVSHTWNPYANGDVLWSRQSDGPYGGDSLLIGASMHDTVGAVEAAIEARADRMHPEIAGPGSFEERVAAGELPLFISTRSGRPPQLFLRQIGSVVPGEVDQIAYSYRSSQRPGVRVREIVSEDGQNGGYWRLDTLYDDQLSVGILGDQPHDFKFQYVGTVYRDLDTGRNEYAGQGTGWIFIPDDDPLGSRVMPPFAGPGNGGWTTEGGPLLILKGEEIHMFLLPTGVRPGEVLEVGEPVRFAGHLMPTLDSQVAVTVTAPSGTPFYVDGQANHVGYFYDPENDFIVTEPGRWSVDVRIWHDGQCSGGATVPPFPSGDVLGSDQGRYWFYVVPSEAQRLPLSSPRPGFLSFKGEVTPVTIGGALPEGLDTVTVDYTLSMPGYILKQGQATLRDGRYEILFVPVALHDEFPNLDLIGRDGWRPGLADTFAIGLLLSGERDGQRVYQANTVTIQGEQVFVGGESVGDFYATYLPLILKGGVSR